MQASQSTTWFISDLHLCDEHPDIIQLFTDFLNTLLPGDSLYILGDFFEYWIGDDEQSTLQQQIANALQMLAARQIKTYFMPGNRDFLIGQDFCAKAQMELLPDPVKIQLGKTDVLLSHGDLFCSQDVSYQRFRKIVHNRLVQKLFLSLSLSTRRKLAQRFRQKSEQSTQSKPADMMDVVAATVTRTMKAFHCQTLIHGHTHRPHDHHNENGFRRLVLGTWDAGKPHIIRATADDISLIPLPNQSD